MRRDLLNEILELKARGEPVALVTNLATGLQDIVTATRTGARLDLSISDLVAARQALIDDRSGEIETTGHRLFVHVHNPAARLMIVGAVHISQSLAPMAMLAGYQVTVIDPRRSFASADRFPGIDLRHDWPDEALEVLRPDSRSAIVTLTHDPKLDDPALTFALRSPAFYIGALGSKKTHAARLERLQAEGFSAADCMRIHGPAGLDIGAKSPAEIAISVMAQLTAALHRRPTR
ncbi:XdhC family protein [Dongia soli]|uniref:XdhC family protein n=1 Tax=Dongia soli TaxID=600628 RepID=A0ABU5EA75_9PROT|nr:XdhC family protein [Dongia soli]MDY0882500.1 XdhC family protein [Dongia soli]